MKFVLESNHWFTSTIKSPVAVMKKQAIINITREGKNPAIPVKIGRPSIPAPTQLPAMSKMPPKTLPFLVETPSKLRSFI